MSYEEVHPAIPHAVTQNGLAVIGESPAVSIGSLYQTIGDSVSMAAINNVYAQQQVHMSEQAAVTASVTNLLNIPI
ncbi:MAG: hypothetical protein QOF62_1500 [Pyrinomonadaceae bacterium]|jgi:hypothetical protein|nr:hypothetical protein [Pyrinomonadaceae bacterium]